MSKSWILPAVAVGLVAFLMSRRGRDLQEQLGDHLGDWMDNLMRSSHRLQHTLSQVQTVLERCNRTMQQMTD
jgi:hypothetical protein